jgi:hypothetical protein
VLFQDLTEGFVIVEIECGSASYRGRGRGRGAVTTVYWSCGGDEGGGGLTCMMIGSDGVN